MDVAIEEAARPSAVSTALSVTEGQHEARAALVNERKLESVILDCR
jgi:hypothetical protein